jgi:hypothetical protein
MKFDIPEKVFRSPNTLLGLLAGVCGCEAPSPISIRPHLCLTNLLGLGDHVRFRELSKSDVVVIRVGSNHPVIWANFVSAALQRENLVRDKCAHDIINAEIGVLVELLDVPDNPVSFFMDVSRVVLPVGSSRFAGDIGRKIDKINRPGVLDIEEGLLPPTARL